ncbi:MAG: M81 family metallopeptidase [Sphingopyxis sp.]|uniref:M81 family metallopeptidase n=1 Tax=Sphingopyxis sp. TaxID=1908224 RepID=UPI002ABC9D41|nr:M81 family metallopeptidase [Sphingopyxis sp.]MDZ3833610.1 M81 family metallopeptidase [Sphingopyxis sp.]
MTSSIPSPTPAKAPVFTALLSTETNGFSTIPTGLASFSEAFVRRDASLEQPHGIGAYLGVFRALAEADGRGVIESVSAGAEPAGLTVQAVYESLRDHILDDLRAAGPVGFVLLGLHGAMMATECDDCEGDLLARVRDIVGPAVPIGVELDPHCHLTKKMRDAADVIVTMKEYPHTDWAARGREVYAICAAMAEGRARPVSAMFDCRMVGFYPTTAQPMHGFVERLTGAEREAGILSVSLVHGFPWGDHPDCGTRLLVIADGDQALAERTAERLGRELYDQRHQLIPAMPSIDQAIDQARSLAGVVVMADTADNSGGGAPGDTTHLLRALIDADIGPCVFGAIFDPGAVTLCAEAGVGAHVPLRIGGKLGPSSGDPFDVSVEVAGLVEDLQQTAFGHRFSFGPSAWVRVGAVDVLLVSRRSQVYARDAFTGMGIELANKRVVAVKSSEHFRADFQAVADHIIPVATPGALQMDFAALPYRRKRDLGFFPRVADPLGVDD